jgi:hypothetical protein
MAPQGGYEAAARRMSYRSEEQQHTDHRQATGFECRGPVSFGEHEVGRSSMPKHCAPMGIFKHDAGAARRDVLHPHMDGFNRFETSDPGAYSPYKGISVGVSAARRARNARARFALRPRPPTSARARGHTHPTPPSGSAPRLRARAPAHPPHEHPGMSTG